MPTVRTRFRFQFRCAVMLLALAGAAGFVSGARAEGQAKVEPGGEPLAWLSSALHELGKDGTEVPDSLQLAIPRRAPTRYEEAVALQQASRRFTELVLDIHLVTAANAKPRLERKAGQPYPEVRSPEDCEATLGQMLPRRVLMVTETLAALRETQGNRPPAPASPVTSAPFADLPRGHWAAPAVVEMAQRNVLVGGANAKFDGDAALSPAEFAATFRRLEADARRRVEVKFPTLTTAPPPKGK